MSEAAELLVIILSVVLAVFLVLAITLVILLIRVTRQIKHVANSAQHAVDNVNEFTANVARFSSPALVGKFMLSQFKKFRSKS